MVRGVAAAFQAHCATCRGNICSLGGWQLGLAVLYIAIRAKAGYLHAQFDHYEITSILQYQPERTAHEAHRATRWREASDLQVGCADKRKYLITYKDSRGQSPGTRWAGGQSVHANLRSNP